MSYRLRTSNKTAENIEKIQNRLHLSTKAAVLRICISLSLIENENCEYEKYEDDNGFEISLSTLFGDDEPLFKNLIFLKEKKKLNTKEYITCVMKHIERGMIMLYGEFATTNSNQELIKKLVNI